jgi:hypothetical protein
MKKYLVAEYLIAVPTLLVLLFIVFHLKESEEKIITNSYKCPTEYADKEEYLESVANYINAYFEKRPNATKEETLKERERWFVSKGCENGHWADYIPTSINFFSHSGYTFPIPDGYIVSKSPGYPDRVMALLKKFSNPKVQAETRLVEFGAVIIETEENPPGTSAIDWVQNLKAKYTISNYKEGLIDERKAFFFYDQDRQISWAVVDSPDGKTLVTIAMFADYPENRYMFNHIINNLTFTQH